jgi:hypothetical protein
VQCLSSSPYNANPDCTAVANQTAENHWWGGNFEGIRTPGRDVSLSVNERLVHAPHVYGPSVCTVVWTRTLVCLAAADVPAFESLPR